jgi:hypothetical protein
MTSYQIGVRTASLYASYEFYFGKRKPMNRSLLAFHNALRILRAIDYQELKGAGLILSHEDWESFRDDPYIFFIRASDTTMNTIWQVIQARQPPELINV